jgi:hypothetical protein
MKKQTPRQLGLLCAFLGLMLSASFCLAQGKVPGAYRTPHQPLAASQATTRASGAVPAASLNYTFTLIDFPGAPATNLYGINSSATPVAEQIVGSYGTVDDDASGNGFLLQMMNNRGVFSETMQNVNFPSSSLQFASSINDSGQIVGIYTDSLGAWHGYELIGGTYTTINVPFQGATGTFAYGLNNAGTNVGCWSQEGSDGHGYELSGGNYTQLDVPSGSGTCAIGINNNGEIVGYYNADGATHGFLLNGGTYTAIDFPGAIVTEPGAIDDAGDVVGLYCLTSCSSGPDGFQGFLLSKGSFSTIDVPGASATAAFGISDKNVIVGYYDDCAGIGHGFIATLPSAP